MIEARWRARARQPTTLLNAHEASDIDPSSPRCGAPARSRPAKLEYTNVFELLAAVLLSAQATDAGVNKATRRLFPREHARSDARARPARATEGHPHDRPVPEGEEPRDLPPARRAPRRRGAALAARRSGPAGVGRKTPTWCSTSPSASRRWRSTRTSSASPTAPAWRPGATRWRWREAARARARRPTRVDAHHWLILHGRYVCRRASRCGSMRRRAWCDSAPALTPSFSGHLQDLAGPARGVRHRMRSMSNGRHQEICGRLDRGGRRDQFFEEFTEALPGPTDRLHRARASDSSTPPRAVRCAAWRCTTGARWRFRHRHRHLNADSGPYLTSWCRWLRDLRARQHPDHAGLPRRVPAAARHPFDPDVSVSRSTACCSGVFSCRTDWAPVNWTQRQLQLVRQIGCGPGPTASRPPPAGHPARGAVGSELAGNRLLTQLLPLPEDSCDAPSAQSRSSAGRGIVQ